MVSLHAGGNTTNMASVCTLEKVLMYAKNLVTRLKDHETTADNLLSQTQDLSKRVDAMKTVSIYLYASVFLFFKNKIKMRI